MVGERAGAGERSDSKPRAARSRNAGHCHRADVDPGGRDASVHSAAADKIAAAAGLPLGVDDKLFIAVDGELAGLGQDGFLVGSTTRRETMSYQLRPLGRPAIYCFGGRFAAAMERQGVAAMFAFAADELAGLLGGHIRRRISPLAATGWLTDPWSRGSYSYAMPGHADDRAILAAPVDDRLFFAGEATSPNFFSTAHGAFISGVAAAEAALASLPPI